MAGWMRGTYIFIYTSRPGGHFTIPLHRKAIHNPRAIINYMPMLCYATPCSCSCPCLYSSHARARASLTVSRSVVSQSVYLSGQLSGYYRFLFFSSVIPDMMLACGLLGNTRKGRAVVCCVAVGGGVCMYVLLSCWRESGIEYYAVTHFV